jgi:hypothetical protein
MQNNPTLTMTPMTLEEVRKAAPQAFASTPKPGVSERYTFLPTSRIIEDMDRLGWKVCQAKASKYRNQANQQFGNHIIKFFHPDIYIKKPEGGVEAYINVVVMNSHTGRGSFRFELGIFRLVCSNGLMIKDNDMGSFQLRHKGYSFEELQVTMNAAIERMPDMVGRINQFNLIEMTPEQQFDFAQKAYNLRAGEEKLLSAEDLRDMLAPRRKEDEGNTIWTVLNRVQESVIKGGFYAVNGKGKLRKVKGIRNIHKDLEINQALWEMAASYA